ncbi:MAG: vWA domain-containing protein [Polyangiaceae bacterium]
MMQSTRLGLILGFCSVLGLGAACSTGPSGGDTRSNSSGGSSSSSSSGGAGNAQGGSVISTSSGGSSVDVGNNPMPAAGACQQAEVKFEPKIPTVYMLVDRSGSMFDCLSTTNSEPSCTTPDDTSWVKLKTAALTVIDSLQTQVRFGFASFTGTNPQAGGTCPIIDQVAPALNNSSAIKTLYDSLAFQPNTTQSGQKFETPARQSLDMIGAKLLAITDPGDKYIIFVTDGQPDYCDDANSLCAPDSVVAGLQALKAKGITTIVMGLQANIMDLAPGILQSFANAGRGEDTLAPLKSGLDTFAFYDQCNSVAGWHADLVTSGKPAERGVTLGTYAAAAGPSKPYTPSASDGAALVSQLSSALQGVKSCSFDLQGKIEVNVDKAGDGKVSIDGTAVTYDAAGSNGWHMVTRTQLQLDGSACEKWRSTGMKINFDFPCDIIVIVK